MTCNKCLVDKPLEQMLYNATHKAYQNICKVCRAAQTKEYRKTLDKDAENARGRDKYHRVSKYTRNMDKAYAASRRWNRKNPERVAHYARQDYARSKGAEGRYSYEEWLTLLQSHDNRCAKCKQLKPLEGEHIVPLSRGGSNYISNIQPLCGTCNRKKHTRIEDYRNATQRATGQLLPSIAANSSEDGG